MIRVVSTFLRPFGIAFGIFILLNLALALQRPELSVTRIWLDVPLAEPWLSLYAALLGASLLVPCRACHKDGVRWICGGVFAAFGVLTLVGTGVFYRDVHEGRLLTSLPVPLSAFLAVILAGELLRVLRPLPSHHRAPPPARVFLGSVAVAAAFLVLTLVHVLTFGYVDHRRKAAAAVVLGAKVHANGRPCDALIDRLETATDLYRQGTVDYLIMSGATGPNGQSEPRVMQRYAVRRGVPASAILTDEGGVNTRASAQGCRRIAREHGFESLLAVTQYFHCARVKMIFEREGLRCATVPTCSRKARKGGGAPRLSRDGFFLLREAVAFPFYLIYYR